MPYPWLCLWDRTLDIPKAQLLTGDQFKGWINLLMIANRFGASGRLPEFDEIAFGLRTDIDTAKELVNTLVIANLIDRHGNVFTMHDWELWQTQKRTNAERSAAYRAQKKALRALGERSTSAQTSADRARARVRVREEKSREERESHTCDPPPPSLLSTPLNEKHPDPDPEPGPEFTALGNLAIDLSADLSFGAWVLNMARLGHTAPAIRFALEQGAAAGKWSHKYLQAILQRVAVDGLPPPPAPKLTNGRPDHGAKKPEDPEHVKARAEFIKRTAIHPPTKGTNHA